MFLLNNYACAEAIANLPLTGNMQPSTLMSPMLGILPEGHALCFFRPSAFLKRLPAHVWAHLVHASVSDSLTLALHADKIFQSCVSSASTVNHISFDPFLGEEFPVHAVCFPTTPCARCYSTPGPSFRHAPAASSASCCSAFLSLCWYHRSHFKLAQECRAPCSWRGN